MGMVWANSGDFCECQSGGDNGRRDPGYFYLGSMVGTIVLDKKVHMGGTLMVVGIARGFRICGKLTIVRSPILRCFFCKVRIKSRG